MRGYFVIPFLFSACLGLGDVESDEEPASGGSSGVKDAGWPDSPAEVGIECDLGQKACNGSCVPFDDPAFGCTPQGCNACQLTGAVVFCLNLECTIDECLPGRMDCDSSSVNGCEIGLDTDSQNCGTCGNACSTLNGSASCIDGKCQIACDPGFGNCDADATDGCETSLSTAQHCGSCPKKCGAGFVCSANDCHCTTGSACDGGSFGECINGTCHCSGGLACPGGKKCTPRGCV